MANKLTMSRGRLRAPFFYDFPARARGNSTLFSMTDVLHQVVNHLVNAVVHRFPGGAGFRRRCHVMGDVLDDFQQFARFVVLAFHHADRTTGLGSHPLLDHREQDLLLFHHVAGEFLVQHGQIFG